MVGVKRVPAEAWSGTQVINIAIPTDEVPTASPMERVMDVIDRLRPESGGAAVVVDDGAIVGLLGHVARRSGCGGGVPVAAAVVAAGHEFLGVERFADADQPCRTQRPWALFLVGDWLSNSSNPQRSTWC